jgi:hypothetical protein
VNRPSGVTKTIREHMLKHHKHEYTTKCKEEGIRIDEDEIGSELDLDARQPAFTQEGLIQRLVQWIAVDDQASYPFM